MFHFSNIVSLTVFPREIIPRHRAMIHHLRIDLFLLASDSTMHGELYILLHNSLSQKWTDWDEEAAAAGGGGDTPWQCAWGAVAELTSLHTLVLTIEISAPRGNKGYLTRQSMSAGLEKWLFEPLVKVTCNDFLLRVNWSAPSLATEEDQPKPAYPFRIKRFASKRP